MKQLNILLIFSVGILMIMSCRNQDVEFPDYDYSTVYFPYQFPVRTIVLGEDIYDNTLDNEHKCEIYASMGGVYSNFEVDNTLCENLYYDAGFTDPVLAMPSSYFTLAAEKISLDGTLQDGVVVQLTDAFFADPDAIRNTYVIPLRMTNVVNADSILSGAPKVENANRVNPDDWDVLPKDYVLYCVKYINPWHGNYLRRGKDDVTKNAESSTVVRHTGQVETDPVWKLSTYSMSEVLYPMDYVNKEGQNLNFSFKISMDENQKATILPLESSYQLNDTVRVYNITATGSGEFVKDGEKKSWGNKDRDVFYLQYNVGYEVEIQYPILGLPDDIETVNYATIDTLVARDRDVKLETFSPTFNVN